MIVGTVVVCGEKSLHIDPRPELYGQRGRRKRSAHTAVYKYVPGIYLYRLYDCFQVTDRQLLSRSQLFFLVNNTLEIYKTAQPLACGCPGQIFIRFENAMRNS